ncbi:sulfite exporter TauE/SafE family protein [Pseudomonas sp. NPDC087612]|uniref:sulfite exporter TauE/SafE family protein n=1 Tax=unclassified Pseudomonas TaxID=196821 RepID=UPI0005EAE24C|nr:sulfite exporter TauE/SafE family protein [Pseudomonas sp. 2(2015)]KJK18038.1 permease [Pseudomonas sp. 2(2015)]
MLLVLLALFGCLSGITTVLFGFGGGFVVVPLLYHLLRMNPATTGSAMQIAVATSTCVMIVSAALATLKHWRAGNLNREFLWPLAAYIALGAVIGAALVGALASEWLRWAFILYLAFTLLDCLLREGFVHGQASARPLGPVRTATCGVLIGSIASVLGVGGSVMSVPLLRRRGLGMTQATAMASPLTLPVALAATATYLITASSDFGPRFVGYVDLSAFALLAFGAWLGTRLAARWIGRIDDRKHAQVYLGLLALVLLSMLWS